MFNFTLLQSNKRDRPPPPKGGQGKQHHPMGAGEKTPLHKRTREGCSMPKSRGQFLPSPSSFWETVWSWGAASLLSSVGRCCSSTSLVGGAVFAALLFWVVLLPSLLLLGCCQHHPKGVRGKQHDQKEEEGGQAVQPEREEKPPRSRTELNSVSLINLSFTRRKSYIK